MYQIARQVVGIIWRFDEKTEQLSSALEMNKRKHAGADKTKIVHYAIGSRLRHRKYTYWSESDTCCSDWRAEANAREHSFTATQMYRADRYAPHRAIRERVHVTHVLSFYNNLWKRSLNYSTAGGESSRAPRSAKEKTSYRSCAAIVCLAGRCMQRYSIAGCLAAAVYMITICILPASIQAVFVNYKLYSICFGLTR